MRLHMDRDGDLDAAIDAAYEQVLDRQLATPLFEEIGRGILADIWRNDNAMRRPGGPAAPSTHRDNVRRGPSERAVSLDPLKDEGGFLCVLYRVNGKWMPLGDMTADDCRAVAADYSGRAESNAKRARFFQSLATRVGKRTVREKFDDERLSRLFEDA